MTTATPKPTRRLLQVSIKADLYEEMRAHCDQIDIPMAIWARELIKRELHPQAAKLLQNNPYPDRD